MATAEMIGINDLFTRQVIPCGRGGCRAWYQVAVGSSLWRCCISALKGLDDPGGGSAREKIQATVRAKKRAFRPDVRGGDRRLRWPASKCRVRRFATLRGLLRCRS